MVYEKQATCRFLLEWGPGSVILVGMAQGVYLSQKMALQQVLAPQLQQSLVLLQAPTLELRALVQQELQQNPVLEEAVTGDLELSENEMREEEDAVKALDPAEPPADVTFDPAIEKPSAEPVDDFQAEFDRLLQLDQEWRDHFSQTNVPSRSSVEDEEKRQFMFDSLVAETSLQEDLLEQVRLSDLPPEQRPVAELVIGNIDDRGYLQASVDELAFSTNIPADRIREVVDVIQTFNPPGVGARDLRECLMLQLERADRQDSLEYRIVRDHMEALSKRRLPDIARRLEISVDAVQQAVARIGRLDPRPGRAFLPDTHQYVVPEVFVQKLGEEYVVSTNNEHLPHLRISNTYKDIMARPESEPEVREYIRDKIRAGKFLIKSLHQRQQTILNIAREIVHRQREFMERGVSALKPLTMLQVAEVVGVHETTVSRAVSGKYVQTPQGVFEMKYFFTSGIKTASGAGISNTSVKEIIAEMVRKENSAKPLSDEEIVRLLSEKGIDIARRTVAKYRSELNVLPSNLRKVY
jgi:RNA polymerase sigma-54 factor